MASLSLFRYSARLTVLIHNDWVLEITLAFKMVKKVGHLAKPKIHRHDANLARGSCLNDRIPLCGTGFEGRGLTSACEEMSEWYWRPSSLTPIAFITFMHFHISGLCGISQVARTKFSLLFHLARKEIDWNVFCMVLRPLAFWILSEETSDCYKSFLFVHMYRLKVIKVLHNGCDLYRTLVHSS